MKAVRRPAPARCELHCFRFQVGHEDWVHSVAWQPPLAHGDGSVEQPLCVLSASMDRTMMLWRPDPGVGAHSRILHSFGSQYQCPRVDPV